MRSENPHTLVLVSQSPRRRELLSERGFRLEIVSPPDGVVEIFEGEPAKLVTENARRKVSAYLETIDDKEEARLRKVFLGVDTLVEYKGSVLGKPVNGEDAIRMLKTLSGNVHSVFSGLHLVGPDGKQVSVFRETKVRFRELSEEGIAFYVSTGEPLDKAGAYGIQGVAGLFIEGIEGCYYNVVGLPLAALCSAIGELGLSVADVLDMSEHA